MQKLHQIGVISSSIHPLNPQYSSIANKINESDSFSINRYDNTTVVRKKQARIILFYYVKIVKYLFSRVLKVIRTVLTVLTKSRDSIS